jgi:hypothetical protein
MNPDVVSQDEKGAPSKEQMQFAYDIITRSSEAIEIIKEDQSTAKDLNNMFYKRDCPKDSLVHVEMLLQMNPKQLF